MKHSYRDLYIWQASVDLAVRVLSLTREPSLRRNFALVDQMQRASISVPSNIAEGKGRLSPKEFRHFLGNARGSLFELATQLEIATRAGYIAPSIHTEVAVEVAKVGAGINNLLKRLNASIPP